MAVLRYLSTSKRTYQSAHVALPPKLLAPFEVRDRELLSQRAIRIFTLPKSGPSVIVVDKLSARLCIAAMWVTLA